MPSFHRIAEITIKHQIRFRDGHIEEVRNPTYLRFELTERQDVPHIQRIVDNLAAELEYQTFGSGLFRFLGDIFTSQDEDKSKLPRDAVYDVSVRIVILDDGEREVHHETFQIVKAAPVFRSP